MAESCVCIPSGRKSGSRYPIPMPVQTIWPVWKSTFREWKRENPRRLPVYRYPQPIIVCGRKRKFSLACPCVWLACLLACVAPSHTKKSSIAFFTNCRQPVYSQFPTAALRTSALNHYSILFQTNPPTTMMTSSSLVSTPSSSSFVEPQHQLQQQPHHESPPAASAAAAELQILDQVSQMTLGEPLQLEDNAVMDTTCTSSSSSAAPSPRLFQTPKQIRKRKNSFVVTPPRLAASLPSLYDENFPGRSIRSTYSSSTSTFLLGLPPMLPDSDELDDAANENNGHHNNDAKNSNPFQRHRPLHSPFTRVSRVNVDFLSSLQESSDMILASPQPSSSNSGSGSDSIISSRIPRLARRQQQQQHFRQLFSTTGTTRTSSQFLTTFPELEDDDVEILQQSRSSNNNNNNNRALSVTRALKMRRRNQAEYPIFEGNL